MFGTIVLAVDGSPYAERAAGLVRKLAAAGGDQVVVTHVTEYLLGRGAALDGTATRRVPSGPGSTPRAPSVCSRLATAQAAPAGDTDR